MARARTQRCLQPDGAVPQTRCHCQGVRLFSPARLLAYEHANAAERWMLRREQPPPSEPAALAAELSAASATLGRSLHARTAANLADVVRIMNTYSSNLIEGHTTRPRDIERALAGEFDRDEERRNLQLEAAAHVREEPRPSVPAVVSARVVTL